MSWEAFRWTAKSPSELYHVLGPHGADDLIRQMIGAVWRDLPAESRSFESAVAAAREVFQRNIAVWQRIKKPGPEEFFADLQPHPADGFLRQAMVLTWMMMPRSGGREVKQAIEIVTALFERNIAGWAADNAIFTGDKSAAAAPKKKKPSTIQAAPPPSRPRPSKKSGAAKARSTSKRVKPAKANKGRSSKK